MPHQSSVSPTDHEVMRRVQMDDADAFAVLCDRYSSRAYRFAVMMCRTPERSEEAVQDAFLRLWRARDSYDPTFAGGIQPWLFTLIRRSCIDITRRYRRGDRLRASDAPLAHLAASGSPEEDVERREEGQELHATLRRLPAAQREVLMLAYFGCLTHVEIAEHLQVPVGTVKGRIRLGLSKARFEMGLAV